MHFFFEITVFSKRNNDGADASYSSSFERRRRRSRRRRQHPDTCNSLSFSLASTLLYLRCPDPKINSLVVVSVSTLSVYRRCEPMTFVSVSVRRPLRDMLVYISFELVSTSSEHRRRRRRDPDIYCST